MPVSIRDVAVSAGVSRATVSKVLNSKSGCEIALETQERVRKVAADMKYHPRALARGLAGKRMDTLGVVLSYDLPSVTSDPFLGPVLDGIFSANKRRKQKTVIFTEDTWEDALANVPVYCDGHCDGLILVAPVIGAGIIEALAQSHTPFVLLGDSREKAPVTVVDVANEDNAFQCVRYLLEKGHRRIAALCGNEVFTSNQQRLAGYCNALNAFGVEIEESLMLPGQYWEWSGRENTARLLQRPDRERPTALFCLSGRIAVGALQALQEAEVSVPEEMSVACISDSTADALKLPLTMMQNSVRLVGEQAVETLLAEIQEGASAVQRVLLVGELREGDSVATVSG